MYPISAILQHLPYKKGKGDAQKLIPYFLWSEIKMQLLMYSIPFFVPPNAVMAF